MWSHFFSTKRSRWFGFSLAGVLYLVLSLTWYFNQIGSFTVFPTRPLDTSKLPDYSVEELIAGLQAESDEGLGTHSAAWASGFIAIDEEPRFRGGILGSAKPVVSPVMKELVSRGVAAMPELLDHVNDHRPTRIVVKLRLGGFGCMWHSDEYSPRYSDRKNLPVNVNTNSMNITEREYTVRVGDLCYVAIGQIVNRHLRAVRYQPTACLVVNSPIETPALAEAVKKDWAGLTADEHQQCLIQDASDPWDDADQSALKRLRFYYPKAHVALVVELHMLAALTITSENSYSLAARFNLLSSGLLLPSRK
jgi:hypothetical protein